MAARPNHLGAVLVVGVLQLVQLLQVFLLPVVMAFLLLRQLLPLFRESLRKD